MSIGGLRKLSKRFCGSNSMRAAEKHMDDILRRIRERDCVLMIDFDGTLAPMVSDPRRARMSMQTRRALEGVARRYPVAVITGRALSDVQARVPTYGVSFAGNHGLECSTKGRVHPVRIPAILQRALNTVRARLRCVALDYKGIYFEDKVHSLSFHYRRCPRSKHAAVRAKVMNAVREAGGLRVVEGIYVLNILPGVRRDKGTATREMYASLAGRKKPVPVFLGDDVTDEDAFRVLRKGITIKVGASKTSAAHYYFKSRSGVDRFLEAMAGK